jgi:hypothetical protein
MPRRFSSRALAREALASRLIEQIMTADIRQGVLLNPMPTRTVDQHLRSHLRRNEMVACWEVPTGDYVILRLVIDGHHLGAMRIETCAGPGDSAWEGLGLHLVLEAQQDVAGLARRIVAREAGGEAMPLTLTTATVEPSSWELLSTEDVP